VPFAPFVLRFLRSWGQTTWQGENEQWYGGPADPLRAGNPCGFRWLEALLVGDTAATPVRENSSGDRGAVSFYCLIRVDWLATHCQVPFL